MPFPLSKRSLTFAGLALLFGAAVGAAGVYGIGAYGSNNATSCTARPEIIAAMKPLAKGEMAGVLVADAPRPVPNLTFQDGEGKPVDLARFHGKTVLLNLWATWCAPCRKEMPALDELQRTLGGADFEVVAVSIDQRDPEKPRRFLAENEIKSLGFFVDPSTGIFQQLRTVGRAVGMPTSLILDSEGCEIAYLPGPAEWASADAVALVKAAIGK